MEKANSTRQQMSQCGNNDMLDVPVGALYRIGHVVVHCDLFGRCAMERRAGLRLGEIRAQQQEQENPTEMSRNFSCQHAAAGPVAKNVRVIPVGFRFPFFFSLL